MSLGHANITPTPTPGHPDGHEHAQSYMIATDLTLLSKTLLLSNEILFDTETMGLPGIPFLLQVEDPTTRSPVIVRVRDHTPQAIYDFIHSLASSGAILVGHNLVFDLAKLTHLATVASILSQNGQGWSEEAVWNAEHIWRPGESSFEDRLQAMQVVWPAVCVDTYLAALRLPPFANELQQYPGITFKKMPVTAVTKLFEKLRVNLNKDAGGIEGRWRLGDHLKWNWDDKPSSAEKKRREQAMSHKDHRLLADVRFSVRYGAPYSLKTLAPLLGYNGVVDHQDFDSIFGESDETFPVWTERGGPDSKECGHIDSWNKSLTLEHDPKMLAYAAADIVMLRHVYNHFKADPGFDALRHDMGLVPWASTVRMVGVHIDEQARDTAKRAYTQKKDEAINHCAALGLANTNSTDQVIAYINKNVVKLVNDALPGDDEDYEEIENGRRKDTLEPLLQNLKSDRQRIEKSGRDTVAISQAITNLDMLMQARVFERKLQFVATIKGDSIFPKFHIGGTQTDRMSCSNPNSQQMPSPDRETDWEKSQEVHFRSMFAPATGWQMNGGDFDQLELRIKSGVTCDPFTQAIYAKETDADPADEHSETALKLFGGQLSTQLPGLQEADILKLLKSKDKRVKHFRSKAKPIGFGIPYGASEFGIARNAECSVDEAKKMLDDYWRLCPATRHSIEAVHRSLTSIQSGADGFGVKVRAPAATAVTNSVGVARQFRIASRLIMIAGKIADSEPGGNGLTYLEQTFPDLANSPVIVTRSKDYTTGVPLQVPVLKALRSSLRGGAFALQGSVHRQSFNFLIQSLGSFLTKELQARIYNQTISPGLHTGGNLPILCGLQVHDEIHFFCKDDSTRAAVDALAKSFLNDASKLVGCPIRFHFDVVKSWADKA